MIKYSQPCLSEEEVGVAAECLRRGALDAGDAYLFFQRALAERLGVPPAWVLLTNSGTTALEAAYTLFRPRVVAVPVLTWPSTYSYLPFEARLYCDVDEYGIIAYKEWSLLDRDSAIIVVELWGRPAPEDLLRGYRLIFDHVILDAAQNVLHPRHAEYLRGGLVDAVAYSFGPLKQLTTLHGGALVAPGAHKRQLWAHSGADGQHKIAPLGRNGRMSEYGAAVGIRQLQRFDQMQAHRQSLLEAYEEGLGSALLTKPHEYSGHLAVMQTRGPLQRQAVQAKLLEAGYQTGVHYTLPYWCNSESYPVAFDLSTEVLTLPCHLGVKVEDAIQIARTAASV